MIGCDDDDQRLARQGARGKTFPAVPPFHGGEIGFAAFQPGDDIAVRSDPLLDRNAGAAPEGGQMRLQQIGADIARCGHAQRRKLDQAAHAPGGFDQRTRQRQEARALVGQHRAAAPAQHQRCCHNLFELADVIHDGRRRQIELARGGANAAGGDHGEEGPGVGQVQHFMRSMPRSLFSGC